SSTRGPLTLCTLSWTPIPGGYAVAMNRDERRTRAPALPPTIIQRAGVPVLVPSDGEAGGSWISVNAHGHCLALLNRWEESPHDPEGAFVSRGLLVLELAGLPGPEAVDSAIAGLPLSRYRPFTLASVARDRTPRLFEWNGRVLERAGIAEPGLVRTSSGSDQAGAERERGGLFREARLRANGLTPEVLADLHRSHRPEKGQLSICMHRTEAVTVSCSLVTVSANRMSFRYVAGSPCEATRFSDHTLP
ncbi:MAG TPA: NRDE family protein, partial [Gemmatimonadales bacterium]